MAELRGPRNVTTKRSRFHRNYSKSVPDFLGSHPKRWYSDLRCNHVSILPASAEKIIHSALIATRTLLRLCPLPILFRPHYGPGVDAASNRNEYQEYLLGVKAAGA
jgi:hypothetical protein